MAQETLPDTKRIVQDPEIMVGRPVVRGMRIPVELVLERLCVDVDLHELFAAYPRLTIEDVQAALLFARDAVRADYLRSRHRKDALAAARTRAELTASTA